MTAAKLAALVALEQAVVAGFNKPTNWRDFDAVFGVSNPSNARIAYERPVNAHRAYHGSLDAFEVLLNKVLPGWKWGLHEPKPGVFRAYVSPWSALRPMPDTAESSVPARAGLLAIIRALIAECK